MIIHVLKDMTVQLEQLDDFKKFAIVADATDDHVGRMEQALAGLAELESSRQAWVFADALKARSGLVSDADWREKFDRMVSAAANYGWVKDDPTRVAAHIVWQDH
jgi:hypothetical protein